MAVSYKGLTIKFGGDTTELQGALKDIQKASRDTQSDLKDINKALKFDPGNTELLQQKVKALNSAYEETKQRLDAYKQALASLESKKQSGAQLTAEEERQYDSLKRAIAQCEGQLDSYGDSIKSAQREADASQTTLYKAGQTLQDNSDKLSSAGSKMKTAGTAISGGIIGAATALSGLAESQEESIQQTNQLETAFESAGGTAEQASSTYAMFYRLLGEGDTATEAAQDLARLTTNQQDLDKWTDIAAGAYATFGDALPLENLAEASQETAHTGTVTGGLADALNWATASNERWSAALSGHADAQAAFNQAIEEGGTKEDAFNAALAACGSEQERSQLITDTLTGLYADAGKQFQETNKDLLDSRDAQNEMSSSMQRLGEAAMPVRTAVAEISADLLDKLAPALEAVTNWYKNLSPEQQQLTQDLAVGAVAFGGVTAAVGGVLEKSNELGEGLKKAAELWTSAKGIIGDTGFLGNAKTAFGDLTGKAGELGETLSGKVSTGWTSFTGLIAAHPIALGVAVVAAAVAGLVWFFTQTETGKQMWSDFTGWITDKWQGVQDFFNGVPSFWGGVWDSMTSKAEEVKTSVGEKWDSMTQDASDALSDMGSAASEKWESIKQTAADKAQGMAEAVKGKWDTLSSNTKTAFANIHSSIKSDMDAANTAGSKAASALQAAMNGDWGKAKQDAASAYETIRSHIDTKMNAAERVAVSYADKIGDKLGFPGLGSKVQGVFDGVRRFIENPIKSAWDSIKDIPGRIQSAFNNIRISIPRPKLPHFNVSWRNVGPVSLPNVSVSWYARGGYFDRPSVIGVGEAGAEHVVADRKLREAIEAAVSRAFSKRNGGGQEISVEVTLYATVADGADAYETGQQIGRGIASKLKQRGVDVAAA